MYAISEAASTPSLVEIDDIKLDHEEGLVVLPILADILDRLTIPVLLQIELQPARKRNVKRQIVKVDEAVEEVCGHDLLLVDCDLLSMSLVAEETLPVLVRLVDAFKVGYCIFLLLRQVLGDET